MPRPMHDPGLSLERRRPLGLWVLAIVAGCFALYNANFRELGLADTIPATLLPAGIVRHHTLNLDRFDSLLRERAPGGLATLRQQVDWTLAIRLAKGHSRSSYPIGGAILATPIYAVPTALGWLRHFDDYRVLGKLSASLFVSLSAGLLFLCLLRFTERGPALFLTGTYALGTSAWVIASQAMWQHGPALLCLSFALWGALRLSEGGDVADALLVSVGSAMAVVCRPQDAVGALAIAAFAFSRAPRRWAALLFPALGIGGLLVWYNLSVFDSLAGGYDALYQSPAHAFRHVTTKTVFTLPVHEGLAGLLISPGKGLFFYSPVLAVALVLLPVTALPASKSAALGRCLTAWVFVTLYFLAKNRLWWGGTSYGPRYLTELGLPLVLSLGLLWHRMMRGRRWLLGAIVFLSSFGVAVQALGAITWECGWHHAPSWLDFDLGRLWNYRDPEIARCAEVLFTKGPRAPEFGPLAP